MPAASLPATAALAKIAMSPTNPSWTRDCWDGKGQDEPTLVGGCTGHVLH